RLLLGQLYRLQLDGVDLRERDHAALDPEEAQDREVLERLRARPLARVDDEEEQVDPARTRDHRAHEALVARDVDHREPPPVGQLERRVSEVDRDAAPALLWQAI